MVTITTAFVCKPNPFVCLIILWCGFFRSFLRRSEKKGFFYSRFKLRNLSDKVLTTHNNFFINWNHKLRHLAKWGISPNIWFFTRKHGWRLWKMVHVYTFKLSLCDSSKRTEMPHKFGIFSINLIDEHGFSWCFSQVLNEIIGMEPPFNVMSFNSVLSIEFQDFFFHSIWCYRR